MVDRMAPEMRFLLGGFGEDLSRLFDKLDLTGSSATTVTDETPHDIELPINCIVVYVFGRYTRSSSQLLSWFSYLHFSSEPRGEYLLALDGVDARKEAFYFLRFLPEIEAGELKQWIESPDHEAFKLHELYSPQDARAVEGQTLNEAQILFGGLDEDLCNLFDELALTKPPVATVTITEASPIRADPDIPKRCTIVYVFGRRTYSSGDLLSWFHYMHHHLDPLREYLVAVGSVEAKEEAFPFLRELPELTIEDLRALLQSDHPT